MTVAVRRVGWWPESERTLADDPDVYPAQTEAHVHWHEHGGIRHLHRHVHPDDHAHSTRSDTAFTEDHR